MPATITGPVTRESTIKVLESVRKRIAKGWCAAYAMDEIGRCVPVHHASAVKLSIVGACQSVCVIHRPRDTHEYRRELYIAYKLLDAANGDDWQSNETSQAAAMEIVGRAITLAKMGTLELLAEADAAYVAKRIALGNYLRVLAELEKKFDEENFWDEPDEQR